MNISSFTLLGFKRPREVVCDTLGKLEQQVMEAIWKRGETSVREIFKSFGEQFAYTTIMTTLDRLHKKGLLSRRKDGRAFLYSPRFSRKEMEQGVARDVIEGLLVNDAAGAEPVLACIVDAVTEHDRELLDELDRLVKQKRRELRRQD